MAEEKSSVRKFLRHLAAKSPGREDKMKWKMEAAVQTHAGRVRGNNEDNFYLAGHIKENVNRMQEQFEGRFNGDLFLAAAADGMGGQAYGEQASLLAVKALKPCCFEQVRETAGSCMKQANQAICRERRRNSGVGMGSTLTTLYVDQGRAICCNIGDSPCYLYREGRLHPLFTAHNRAERMVQTGILTRQQAVEHPGRHELTQYLGIFQEEMILQPAFSEEILLKEGDFFLLATDGLTDGLTEEAIEALLSRNIDADCGKITEILLQEALSNGSRDNITVLAVKIRKHRMIPTTLLPTFVRTICKGKG